MPKKRTPPSPRDSRGRFLPGHSGHSAGRPKGTRSSPEDSSHKLPIQQGGKTKHIDPRPVIMRKLARAAIAGEDVESARLYLREVRLAERQRAKAMLTGPPASRSRHELLYYERALLSLGVLKINSHGQIVMSSNVFADLDRFYSKGNFGAADWKAIQLTVESSRVLRVRYPHRQRGLLTEAQGNRARAQALDEAYAEYDALAADAAEYRRMTGSKRKKTR